LFLKPKGQIAFLPLLSPYLSRCMDASLIRLGSAFMWKQQKYQRFIRIMSNARQCKTGFHRIARKCRLDINE